MASLLAPTYGIWMVGLFLMSILLGMGLLQVCLYFLWYHKDHWGIKATVILITVLEVTQTSLFFSATYTQLIDGFGDFEGLGVLPWQGPTQILLLVIFLPPPPKLTLIMVVLTRRRYFSYCIYILYMRRVLFSLFIAMLAFASFGAGVAEVILTFAADGYSFDRLNMIKELTGFGSIAAVSNTQAAVALTCDVSITASLCWRLNSSKTGIQSTNQLLNFLIMTTINRGVLTMVTAFVTQPGTFYFLFVLLISGKFYMNSMLAMLNTRKHAQSIAKLAEMTVDHISLSGFPPTTTSEGINVSVTRETTTDRGGKISF
ncbi:hypothetical protein FB451DRAFT_1448793 [Mycena latifolia]|nr:hypothetical protein FB451DRAFT_1448793 [Mycena latifolia]